MKIAYIKPIFPGLNIIPGIACMLLMIQAYLVAPLAPSLERDFNSSLINLAIPAFALPFAVASIGMVFLKPAFNLRRYMLLSLGILCLSTFLLSTADSAEAFLLIRAITGLGTGIMLPSALVLAVRPGEETPSFNYMALVFFALAAGMTFGPRLGGWLHGLIGWRCLYVGTGMLAALLFCIYLINQIQSPYITGVEPHGEAAITQLAKKQNGYVYSFVYLTGLFHSGVFVWISYYFATHYQLDEFHIATDLFIFGLPGFVASVLMHRYQIDKKVTTILYLTLGLTISGLLVLMGDLPIWLAECLLGVMSIGFGCSQPLFIGILNLPQAGALNMAPIAKGCGILFAGYGSGPLVMIALLKVDLVTAVLFLIFIVMVLAYLSRHIWNINASEA